MSMLDRKDRIDWLDVLKGILIIFVILSHSYPPDIYRYFFTPFFLTMFFWASGYTFSMKGSGKEFLLKKCRSLLIPLLALGCIRIILAQIIEGGSWKKRITGLFVQINCQYDELWFVACLFTASICFYGLLKLFGCIKWCKNELFLVGVSGIFLFIAMVIMCIWKMHIPWQLELAFMMCFYMALGYYYRRHEEKIEACWGNKWIVILLGIIYCIGVFGFPNSVDIHKEQFEYPILFLALSLVCILPVIMISKRIARYEWKKIFVFWGQNTLFYYAFGGTVRVVLYKILEMVGVENVYLVSIVCTVLTMFVLMIPAWVVRGYFPWMVGLRYIREN